MSLDQPASASAFWQIFDATKIRPEFLIPVLSYESGLDPSVQNGAGAPYYGIGQNSLAAATAAGATSAADYLTWPASKQLQLVVLPYFKGIVSQYGPLKSGVQVYQAEFYPASLAYARSPDSTIVSSPAAAYTSNAGFDTSKKGYITPRDLARAIGSQLSKQNVQDAISAAYAQRPWMWPPEDPIWGDTLLLPKLAWAAVGIAAAAGVAYVWMELEGVPRWAPRWVRRIV